MAVELTGREIVYQNFIFQHAIMLRAIVNSLMNLRVP